MNLNQKVKFYNPKPENAAYSGLKKSILELDNQEMTLQEGLNKLRKANKTSFSIEPSGERNCISIYVTKVNSWLGKQTITLTLIDFEVIP